MTGRIVSATGCTGEAESWESRRLKRDLPKRRFGLATVTISSPVFPLIPPYSVSESPNPLFLLNPVAGFEPEGRGFESLPAYHLESVHSGDMVYRLFRRHR